MNATEWFSWFMVGVCFVGGIRATSQIKGAATKTVAALWTWVALMQAIGIAFFLSSALWLRTARDFGLVP